MLLLRNADSLAEAEHYYIHVTHALYEYVRRMAAVKIPQKKFKMEIRNIFLYSLDVFEFDVTSSSFEDMIIGNIDYERFSSCLLPLDAKMLSMRMKGSS